MEYLFAKWKEIKERLFEKHIFIFLDFDGTLTPIVETPGKACLSKKVKEILEALLESQNIGVAFISGRSLEDIKNKIAIQNAIYAGNYGLEIEGPKIKYKSLVSENYRPIIQRIKNELEKKIVSIPGAFVEDKGLTLSLHYRLVNKKQIPEIKTIFHETLITHIAGGKIKTKSGKRVLEIMPPVEWDKGKVVLWLLARAQFGLAEKEILPVYFGDDVSDEDAFKALRNKGINVFVGKTKNSSAQYYVNNPNETVEFLKKIKEEICQD